MNRPRNPSRRPRRGFTLVESIATIVVLVIISGVSSGIILQATDGYVEAATQARLASEASVAMDRLAREVRKIPLDTGVAGVAPDITLVTSTYLGWDANNSISLSGSDLMLKLNATPRIITSDVTGLVIKVYDESNADLGQPLGGAACDAIRRVEFDLTVARQGVETRVRSRVFVRSTMAGAAH